MDVSKIKEVIELLKNTSEPIWDFAREACLYAGIFEILIGLIFMISGGVIVWGINKRDWDEGAIIITLVLSIFGLMLACTGGYELLTLDFQTYQSLLP